MIAQGEIRWLEEPDRKPRPALILVRDRAIPHLTSITVAPLSRTIRGIPTEVPLGPDDGLAVDSVATFDNVRSVSRSMITDLVGHIQPGRWHEVCAAVSAAIKC